MVPYTLLNSLHLYSNLCHTVIASGVDMCVVSENLRTLIMPAENITSFLGSPDVQRNGSCYCHCKANT